MRQAKGLLVLLITGCSTLQPMGRTLDLTIYPQFQPNTQAIIPAYTLGSIATLEVIPYIEVSSEVYSPISALTGAPTAPGAPDVLKLSQATPDIDPSRPFVLKGLKPNKKYRILGKAYDGGQLPISQDTTSFVEVVLTDDDRPPFAQLPIRLVDRPFGASASVSLQTTGRFDYLKTTLFLVSGGSQVAVTQTSNPAPTLLFGNLQGNSNYRLVVEAYKLGAVVASNSVDLAIANNNTDNTAGLSLNVPYVTTTFVGNGTSGTANGTLSSATLKEPHGVVQDSLGNFYVAEYGNHSIRKITPGGVVSTFAGSGTAGFTNGNGTLARFNGPAGLITDANNNLYVTDRLNHCVRKITPAGVVSTFVGNGTSGSTDGTGTNALFKDLYGITIDAAGNLYISDTGNCRIRKVTPEGVVTILAGGSFGYADGTGTAAQFDAPGGITIDPGGILYLAGNPDNRIRKVTPSGVVTTLAGNGTAGYADGTGTLAQFNTPKDITCDTQGFLYVSDYTSQRIRRVSPTGVVTTIAGNGIAGYLNGTGLNTKVAAPRGLTIDHQGNLFVADSVNHSIRKIQ